MGNFNLEIKSNKKIAIVDCNNFYISCERLFNPELRFQPTVVLSNNDGCIIARSNEVKEAGIKMGQPLFQLDDAAQKVIRKFSSNYTLYGDISDRISKILKRFSDSVEIYSIDESFLDVSNIPDNQLTEWCYSLKSELLRLTGIPVSIGVGPNKTLAKLTNFLAKRGNGICNYWETPISIDKIDVGEVWGIGRKINQKLIRNNIHTVGQFKETPDYIIRKLIKTPGFRTWLELNENLIFKIETTFKKPKIISASRTFPTPIHNANQIQNAFWTFIVESIQNLKEESLKANTITFFIHTNPYSDFYQFSKKIKLYQPTNQVEEIWNQIFPHLMKIPSQPWTRAGIQLSQLIPQEIMTPKLFEEVFCPEKPPIVNKQEWMTKREFLSPNWTTSWKEIPIIK